LQFTQIAPAINKIARMIFLTESDYHQIYINLDINSPLNSHAKFDCASIKADLYILGKIGQTLNNYIAQPLKRGVP